MTILARDNTVKSAARHYRHAVRLDGTSLRYFVDRRTGQHLVVREFANDSPIVHRHDRIEDARRTWARIEATIVKDGYQRLPG
jgi:hypothetical protein